MLWADGSSLLLVLMAVYVAFMQPFLDTVALSLDDWLLIVPFILMASIAAEATKVYLRWRAARHAPAVAAG